MISFVNLQILEHELPPLHAQLKLLEANDKDARQSRVHVERNPEPAMETLANEFNRINEMTRDKLQGLIEAEKQEKIVVIQFELEKLRTEPVDDEKLIKLEEQITQLPLEDEATKALAAQLQQIRAKKEEREAIQKALDEKLSYIATRLDELEKAESIDTLNKAITEIQDQIMPQLDQISQQSQENALHLFALEPLTDRTRLLVATSKVHWFFNN